MTGSVINYYLFDHLLRRNLSSGSRDFHVVCLFDYWLFRESSYINSSASDGTPFPYYSKVHTILRRPRLTGAGMATPCWLTADSITVLRLLSTRTVTTANMDRYPASFITWARVVWMRGLNSFRRNSGERSKPERPLLCAVHAQWPGQRSEWKGAVERTKSTELRDINVTSLASWNTFIKFSTAAARFTRGSRTSPPQCPPIRLESLGLNCIHHSTFNSAILIFINK